MVDDMVFSQKEKDIIKVRAQMAQKYKVEILEEESKKEEMDSVDRSLHNLSSRRESSRINLSSR